MLRAGNNTFQVNAENISQLQQTLTQTRYVLGVNRGLQRNSQDIWCINGNNVLEYAQGLQASYRDHLSKPNKWRRFIPGNATLQRKVMLAAYGLAWSLTDSLSVDVQDDSQEGLRTQQLSVLNSFCDYLSQSLFSKHPFIQQMIPVLEQVKNLSAHDKREVVESQNIVTQDVSSSRLISTLPKFSDDVSSKYEAAAAYLKKYNHSHGLYRLFARMFGDYHAHLHDYIASEIKELNEHLHNVLSNNTRRISRSGLESLLNRLDILTRDLPRDEFYTQVKHYLATVRSLPKKDILTPPDSDERVSTNIKKDNPMALLSEQDIYQLVDAYLQNRRFDVDKFGWRVLKHWFTTDAVHLQFVTDQITQAWQAAAEFPDQQKAIITGCRRALKQHKSSASAEIQQRRAAFKKQVRITFMEYGYEPELALNANHPETRTQHNIDANAPVELAKERLKLSTKTGKSGQSVAAIGDLFCTNNPNILQQRGDAPQAQILDALYTGYAQDGGLIAAIGDGAGGHNDLESNQDQVIAAVSRVGTKKTVQYLSTMPDPDTLKRSIPMIVAKLKQDLIAAQPQGMSESTILIGVRAYPTGDNQLRCVGFNTGDCLLAYWDPTVQQLKTLSPAVGHIETDRHNKVTPGSLPYGDDLQQFRVIDAVIPREAKLFMLTDGAYDYLPTISQDMQPKSALTETTLATEADSDYLVHTTHLQDEVFTADIKATDGSAAAGSQAVIQRLLSYFETRRNERLQQAKDAIPQFDEVNQEYTRLSETAASNEALTKQRQRCEHWARKQYFTLGDDTTCAVLPAFIAPPTTRRHQPACYHTQAIMEANEEVRRSELRR